VKYQPLPPDARYAIEDWDHAMSTAPSHDCVPVLSTDPLYILYTSGTTGQPKGVLRDSGGYAVALQNSMANFMNVRPGETYWAASDVGWVVGHSYIVYGPLLLGCTTVLFEGKPISPDAGVFWRIIQQYKVAAMFTAPTALRAIRKFDPALALYKNYDTTSLRTLFVAGERGDPDTVSFFSERMAIPVVDNFWQTELGWPCLGEQASDIGTRPGSAARPVPGYDMRILNEASEETATGTLGDVAIKLPLPPGTLQTLYQADARCVDAYFRRHQGYYNTGDAGFRDQDGYFHIMARIDDVINCAGHRLSSGAIEEVLISHPDVAECAVIGAFDPLKHQVPVGLIVLNNACTKPPAQVEREVVDLVRKDIGPVAFFKVALVVDSLPKTRSGKILRGILLKIADGKEYTVPGTIDDINVVHACQKVLEQRWCSKPQF
jgi:propionyl-CoA synthetase